MDWNKATSDQINKRIQSAIDNGTGVTVSPKWLLHVFESARNVAKLASDEPMFYNPIVVAEAKHTRDQFLNNEWPEWNDC